MKARSATGKVLSSPFFGMNNGVARRTSSSGSPRKGGGGGSSKTYTASSLGGGSGLSSGSKFMNNPTYATCHGLEVSNVDNYIANLFR